MHRLRLSGPGTQRTNTYHRAIAASENSLARYVIRMASKNGYLQKPLYELTSSSWRRFVPRGIDGEGTQALLVAHTAPRAQIRCSGLRLPGRANIILRAISPRD